MNSLSKTIAKLPVAIILLLALLQGSLAQTSTKTFYLLPPGTSDYIGGIPYIALSAEQYEPKPMLIDPSKCGWYRTVFDEPVSGDIVIGLGPLMRQPVTGGKIALASKFEELASNAIYYQADANKWTTTYAGISEESNRCSYKFTAIIYDTDQSIYGNGNNTNPLQGPFKCGIYETCSEGTGISRGIPNETLNDKRKMTYRGAGAVNNDGWSAATLAEAFTPTPGKNVKRCYEMPFAKDNNGLWEFNSNKLCANGQMASNGNCASSGGYMGGFFPLELQSPFKDSDGIPGDYSECEACRNTHRAETWAPLASTVNKWCYDRGWLGTGSATGNLFGLTTAAAVNAEMQRVCTRQLTNGDLRNGDNPPVPGSTSSIWNWDGRQNFGGESSNASTRNLFFCFESHAEFVYDPAQEFYFSGDDDIWVFINNQLVIDLGGSHLAAPGYVKLDTITKPQKLEEGETYPIDIFFCDSRSTMSNVSIRSNIYFAQKPVNGREPGLYKQTDDKICLQESGTSCAALRGGGTVPPVCGQALASRLSYKIAVPGWGEVQLDEGNDKCIWLSSTRGVCYGGILLNEGTVRINATAVAANESYLAENGFDVHAMVQGYSSLNVSKAVPVDPSPIKPQTPRYNPKTSISYYNLKGEPLGSKKPTVAGIYIVRQNGASRVVIVRH